MGRTIPSFRIASSSEENEWKSFRNSLAKSDRKIFDEMFSIAHLYYSASSYAVKPIRIQPIFMSIIFHHYKRLTRLSKNDNLCFSPFFITITATYYWMECNSEYNGRGLPRTILLPWPMVRKKPF
jgi:hypothetical protein